MKAIRRHVNTFVVALLVLNASSQLTSSADADGTSKLLKGKAAQHQLNVAAKEISDRLSAIETWRAEVQIEESFQTKASRRSKNDEKAIGTRPVNVQFVWDQSSQSLFSKMAIADKTKITKRGGETYETDSPSLCLKSIIKPGGFYQMHSDSLVGELAGLPKSTIQNKRFTRLITRESSSASRNYSYLSTVFDPAELFRVGGFTIGDLVNSYAAQTVNPVAMDILSVHTNKKKAELTVSKKYLVGGDDKTETHDLVLDRKNHYLPKMYVVTSDAGQVTRNIKWKYQTLDGVTFLSHFEISIWNSKDGQLNFRRRCRFTNSEINFPIDEEQFDISMFSPSDGDRYWDKISNKLFVFENGQRIDPESYVDKALNINN